MRHHRFHASNRVAPVLLVLSLLAAPACGRLAEEPSSSSDTGDARTTSPTGSESREPAGDVDVPGTPSGPLGPSSCAAGEGALVAVSSAGQTRARMQSGEAWAPPVVLGGGVPALTTYQQGLELGVFLVAGETSRFTGTTDGLTYDAMRDAAPFAPTLPPVAAGPRTLVAQTAAGLVTARFDPDSLGWSVGPATDTRVHPFDGSSAAVIDASAHSVLVAGRLPDGVLFDQSFDGTSWQPVHRHEGVHVRQNEIRITSPRVVAFDEDGDVVIVFMPSLSGDLAATTRRGGAWSVPVTISSSAIGVSFAAARTPGGDVVVAVRSLSGDVSVIPFSRTLGWGRPVTLDSTTDGSGAVAVATGICGDDALVAYGGGAGSSLEVARVKGSNASRTSVFDAAGSVEEHERLSIVTRPAP